MTDEQIPEDAETPGSEGDPADLPPPSTWAGKARKAEAEGETERDSHGITEEFEGLADELSADFDDLEADEAEEPPDEFAFEEAEDDLETPEPGSDSSMPTAAASPHSGEAPDPTAADTPDPPVTASPGEVPDPPVAESPTPPPSSETVEADTLALSEVEAAREAAHAGLAARAKKSSFSHEVTTGAHKVQAKPEPQAPAAAPALVAGEGDSEGVGEPPKRRIGLRFVAAAFVIVSSMAAATAVSFLLFLSDIAEGLNDDGSLGAARAQLEDVEGGAPQTILVLGSDKRDTTQGDPGRSDTAILLRVDPDKEFLSLMSMPRDLYVPIPGHGTDKLNAAYTYGEQIRRRRRDARDQDD